MSAANNHSQTRHISSSSNNTAAEDYDDDDVLWTDRGVDYGPPVELEVQVHQQRNSENKSAAAEIMTEVQKAATDEDCQNTSSNNTSNNSCIVTLEELEETVGLHEATLQSLHDKVSKLNEDIAHEQQIASLLQHDIDKLKKKKIILKKRTENNALLVKELEGTLDKCLDRLRRALLLLSSDVEHINDDNDDAEKNANEEEDDDDDEVEQHHQQALHVGTSEVPNDNDDHEIMQSEEVEEPKQSSDFEISKFPMMSHDNKNTWPTIITSSVGNSKDYIKRIRKEVSTLPFAFPIWRTNIFSSWVLSYTIIDVSYKKLLLLDMMNMTVLEYLLCREERKIDGCGQVRESKIWGTSLDIMTHLNWEHLLSSLQQRETVVETGVHMCSSIKEENKFDPNVTLCPYELGGTCADDRCPYQHLSCRASIQAGVMTNKSLSGQDYYNEVIIKYHNLPKVTLPPSPFADDRKNADADVGDIAMNDVDTKRSRLTSRERDNEDYDPSIGTAPTHETVFEENDDYVSLPSVTENTDGHNSNTAAINNGNNNDNNSRDLEFCERFWWYNEHPFHTSWNIVGRGGGGGEVENQDVIEKVVASFGFRRNGKFLDLIRQSSSNGDNKVVTLQKELIFVSRLIDLCRVCVHMGQSSFALSVLETCKKQKHQGGFHKILEVTRAKVESSLNCSSSQFDLQIYLLVISKCTRANYDSFEESLDSTKLTKQHDFMSSLDIISGKKKDEKYADLFQTLLSRLPKRHKVSSTHSESKWAAFERSLYTMLEKHVVIPFSQVSKEEEYSFFLNCVHIGKLLQDVIYEVSQESRTFSPLFHALEPVWASLQTLLRTNYALSRVSDWLRPDLVVAVIVGPIIFACVTKTIEVTLPSQDEDIQIIDVVYREAKLGLSLTQQSNQVSVREIAANAPSANLVQPGDVLVGINGKRFPRSDLKLVLKALKDTLRPMTVNFVRRTSKTGGKYLPKLDMRTIANMTCLDNCIIGILKELNKSSQKNERGELVELLVTPLHAVSVGISMAVGMVEKAQSKVMYALSKGTICRGVPSLYAMSSLLWSQLVQINITFPAYSTPLRQKDTLPSLPNETITSHQNIVSTLCEHGVILNSIALPGDFQITTSPLCTKGSKAEYIAVWEEVKRAIIERYLHSDQRENITEIEVVVANYMNAYSCFPETLLLTGTALTKLRMTNSGLTELPLSLGFYLTNLQVLNISNNFLRNLPSSMRLLQSLKVLNVAHNLFEEFPDTVIHCKLLEVLDISHNKLQSFPGDLALRLPLLQSFLVVNNPLL